MLMIKTIMSQVQEGDWFVNHRPEDAYFTSKSFKPGGFFGLPLEGRLTNTRSCPSAWLGAENVTKCMDAALAPLRLQDIRVLNYLDDWLILAHSRELVSRNRDIVLGHIHSLGLIKPPRRFKVAHPGQACASSSPLVPRQVPLFEGGSRSGSTEPGGRFSVETEAQAGGMECWTVRRYLQIWDLFGKAKVDLFASQESSQCPALVLPEFPDDSGIDASRPPMAECQSVRVPPIKLMSGSTMQSEGERCPSPSHSHILALQTWFSELTPLLYQHLLGRFQSGGTYCPSFRARSASLSRSSGSCGYGPYRAKGCDWWFACRSSGNHSQCQSPLY